MPRLKKGSLPTYRHHKARNCGVVTIDGHDHYLGPYDTPASKQKYAALIRAWQQRQENPDQNHHQPLQPSDRSTVNELILVYLRHVSDYYRANNGENKEAGCVDDALKVVQGCGYGGEFADMFRPRDLKIVRDTMIRKGWSRNYINAQVNRVRRMFRHAAEEDLVPGSIFHDLQAVKGLRKGTPGVRETKKVRPVKKADLKQVLDLALGKSLLMLRAMILFAYRTGVRPGELCAMKPVHIDRRGKVWVYTVPPEANKNEHHDHERKVYIGPRAQKILAPWLKGLQPGEYAFSPTKAEAARQADRRKARKTPLWPSHVKAQTAKKKASPKRAKRNHYDPASFRRAIHRLCSDAGVTPWSPNQLRHNAATRFRRKYGIEVARVLLGHSRVATSEIYAERDMQTARKAAQELG